MVMINKSYIITISEYNQLKNYLNKLKILWGGNKQNQLWRTGFNPLNEKAELSSTEPEEDSQAFVAMTRRTLRLFLISYILTNLYENLALGLLKRKGTVKILKDTLSISALRLAGFITAYSTLYRYLNSYFSRQIRSISSCAVDESSSTSVNFVRLNQLISKLLTSPRLAPFLAGSLASITMLFESPGSRRVSIAISALTRAIQSSLDATSTTKYLPGYLLFALSNAILLHSFVFDPSEFPPGYGNFILKYSKAYLPERPSDYSLDTPFPTSREIVDAIASSAKSNYPKFISPLLHRPINSSIKTISKDEIMKKVIPILEFTHPNHSNLTCAFLHPSETNCFKVSKQFIKTEFRSSSKFFSLLTLFTTLLKYKKLTFTSSPSMLLKALLSITTSSAFLSLSIATAWGSICFFQKYLPTYFLPEKRFYLQGFLAGLWVALISIGTNDKSGDRTLDLGWYSVRTALPTFWGVAIKGSGKGGLMKRLRVRNGEVIYFSVSMGVLMMLWECNPEVISSGFVKRLLKVISGESKASLDPEMKKNEVDTEG